MTPMELARSRMSMRHTFFASILFRTPMIEDNTIPTAATDMIKIYYNAEFIKGLSKDVVMFVLAHEVFHIILKHGLRRRGRDIELWNIACDFAINIMLKQHEFVVWEKCYHDKWNGKPVEFDGLSAEAIYDILLQDMPPQGAGGGGKGDQGGMGHDVKEPAGADAAQRSEIGRQIDQKVAQAHISAKMAGHGSAALDQLVKGLLNPPLTWQELLRDFCTRMTPQDSNWGRRNRRFAHIYLPSVWSEAMGELVIVGDTSGSLISSNIFAQIGAEIAEIREQVKPERVRVIWADDAECSLEEVFEPNDDVVLHPKGGGGTDMRRPLQHIHQFNPIVAVLVTDGYTPWPNEDDLSFPLIILCNTDAPCPDWATVIRIKGDGK